MLLQRPALYTDFYELTMAQGYFLSGRKDEPASFDYFFRNLPFNGGYVVFAGLSDVVECLESLKFHEDEIEFLREQEFNEAFLDYLKDFTFNGNLYSVREGELVFPHEPVIRLEGNLIETQIIETLLLNLINFESLIATKATRLKYVADGRLVVDFGLRRAQGLGGIQVSKASAIGGLDGTSNVLAAKTYGLKVNGTMAHSWIQSFESELQAFREYADFYPNSCVLLVDTYNTLTSGVPNAITVAKELESKGHELKAIRLDSGDLAYLSKKARQLLDKEGLQDVKIAVSNQLDEYLIKSLIEQKAPIDMFGVGTRLATSHDDPALNGVYKLNTIDHRPTLKISDNVEKITLPGKKRVLRFLNSDGTFNSDGIVMQLESGCEMIYHPFFPMKKTDVRKLPSVNLLNTVMENGEVKIDMPSVSDAAAYAAKQFSLLNDEHKRFDNPHVYKVGISAGLMNLRDQLMDGH